MVLYYVIEIHNTNRKQIKGKTFYIMFYVKSQYLNLKNVSA